MLYIIIYFSVTVCIWFMRIKFIHADNGNCRMCKLNVSTYKEFADTKGIIRIRKSKKDRQHNGQRNKQRSTTIYKTLHRKPKIEQHELH